MAAVLGARRDGTASVDSSRALLMSVLGELVLPNGCSAWTQTLLRAMEQLGVRDKAARQALARMQENGWLKGSRRGRQTRWALTDRAVDLLATGADRIYRFGQEPRDWDGSWLILFASVPESDRHIRYRMTQGLNWAGFGSLGQGTWVSPWQDREEGLVALLRELGVDATSFRAELGRIGSASKIANTAWDLEALRTSYDEFLADTTDLLAEKAVGEQAVGELTALVHRWRRFPFLDPDLPISVLRPDWPGPEAAHRFNELRAALLPEVNAWWEATEFSFTPSSDH